MPSFKTLPVLPLILLAVLVATSSASLAPQKNRSAPIKLRYPNGLALADSGDLYLSDIGAHRVFKLNLRAPGQRRLTVVAGTGESGFSGDGGPAINARLFAPHDLAFDAEGNLLIADTLNHRIRRLDRRGVITTIAGDGKAPASVYSHPATNASLNNPQSLALDRAGNILVADTYNHLVRRLDRNGVMTVFAGTVPGFGGDGGPANRAQISLPMAVAVGPDDSVYISDAGNSRIRRVAPDGVIQTIAGFGPAQDTYGGGFAGDGGPAEKAKLFSATDLKLDAAGNLYLADSGNHRIRVIREGIINTVAGSGRQGLGGDGRPATEAQLNTPQKLALGRDGSLYLSDRANQRVRKVDSRGFITTIAGTGKPVAMIIDPEK